MGTRGKGRTPDASTHGRGEPAPQDAGPGGAYDGFDGHNGFAGHAGHAGHAGLNGGDGHDGFGGLGADSGIYQAEWADEPADESGAAVSGAGASRGGTGGGGAGRVSSGGAGGRGGAEAPTRGRAERRRTAKRAAKRRRRSLVRELPLIAVVAIVIALVLKTFLVQVFVIPSGSMEQTIQVGDRVLVDKLTPWFGSEPGRGDVVVFKDPGGWLEAEHKQSSDGPVMHRVKSVLSYAGLLPSDDERDLIKRVIGVGGDTVECCDSKGRLSINGKPVDEPYIAPGNAPSRQPFKVTVPQGRLWVMGDHRDLSADSRYHMANPGSGTIPMENVVGRAFVIAWPVSRFGQLEVPDSLSSLSAGSAAGSVGLRPDPAEPPLVMGVLGVLPALVRRRPGSRGA